LHPLRALAQINNALFAGFLIAVSDFRQGLAGGVFVADVILDPGAMFFRPAGTIIGGRGLSDSGST